MSNGLRGMNQNRYWGILDTHFTLRAPWKLWDEARFHSFCMGISIGKYLRQAIEKQNMEMRDYEPTKQRLEALAALGGSGAYGWPTREEQKQAGLDGNKNPRPYVPKAKLEQETPLSSVSDEQGGEAESQTEEGDV